MTEERSMGGFLRPEELYTLDEIKRRLHIGDAALRSARRAGLTVHYRHGRGFVLGRDWIKYIRSSEPQNDTEQ
jgi:hypothetical protein